MNKKWHILFDYDGVLIHKVDFARFVSEKYGADEVGIRSFFKEHLPNCLKGENDIKKLLSQNLEKIGWFGTGSELFNALYLETKQYNEQF